MIYYRESLGRLRNIESDAAAYNLAALKELNLDNISVEELLSGDISGWFQTEKQLT
jgi:hypothetical protein